VRKLLSALLPVALLVSATSTSVVLSTPPAAAAEERCLFVIRNPPGTTRLSNQCEADVRVIWQDQGRCSTICSEVVPAGQNIAVREWVGVTKMCTTTPEGECTPEEF